jgi:predicted secreted protein
MRSVSRICVAAVWLVAAGVWAQPLPYPPPQNVLQLSASGTVEVQQDLLHLSLTTTREGPEASAIQAQLKAALDAALTEAKKAAQPGQMDVRTGNFSLYPRYNQGGKIGSWQGSAELVLEGRDFPRITQAAGRIQTMTVGSVTFGLSREQRAKVEGDAQLAAIERFKAKAAELAKGFGFTGYSLREVSVNSNDQDSPRPLRMASASVSQAPGSPLPVEAGKSAVTVIVSGSVQLK